MTMNCPGCGMPSREGARWCDRCGARMPESSNSGHPQVGAPLPAKSSLRSWQKHCPECGKVSSNETICGYCGADLAWQAAPVKKSRGSFRELALIALGALLVIAFVSASGSGIGKARNGSDQYAEQANSAVAGQVDEPTATPLLPTPTATPTPDTAPLLRRADAAWAKADWPEVISMLQQLRKIVPNSVDYTNKLYVAHLSYGVKLLAAGDRQGAAAQFSQAKSVDPGRKEAEAQLAALTPTPTPTMTVAQRCAKAEEPDPGEIGVDPSVFKGRTVLLNGTINAADYQYSGGYTMVQFLADIPYRPYDDAVLVAIKVSGRAPNLVRNKRMKVCGTVSGSEQIDIIPTGTKSSVPSIQALLME